MNSKKLTASAIALFSCAAAFASGLPLTSKTLINRAAYIPPQCYTVIKDKDGAKHNPCYTCHRDSVEPNYNKDAKLQTDYSFPEYAMTNRWTNLFKDRTGDIADQSDKQILEYVRQDNYKDVHGGLILAEKLKQVPDEWDFNHDGKWRGYVPDCYFNIDGDGFDHDTKGGYTLWRAFAYAPFPGAFWPANGSADDVLIRLWRPFALDENGRFSLQVYKINLAITETLIKRTDTAISSVDEKTFGVDLNADGRLDTADRVAYSWAPRKGLHMSYVGMAKTLLKKGKIHLAAGLFPENTEFLHSVRYLDVDANGVVMGKRMKELRYAKKTDWYTYSALDRLAYAEKKEKHDFPDRLSAFYGDIEHGLGNGQGWTYQGFIEDKDGGLRPQTYEETVYCMGCHSGLGATDDGIVSFNRKYGKEAKNGGWYHWSQKGFKDTPEQMKDYDGKGMRPEYTAYLENNGAGDEFRGNTEIISAFFDADGKLRPEKINALHSDISVLLLPSITRALALDKAYRAVVREQSYIYGRDAVISPPQNVYKEIPAAYR